MRLADIDFRDRDAGIRARIEFTYVPLEDEPRKWLTVMSLKKTDREASFVFRINAAERYFQVYFGDGQATRGNARISTAGFAGKRCVLEYTRTRDLTFLTLTAGSTKAVRFALHAGAAAVPVEEKYYEEGGPADGVALHRAEFDTFRARDVSISDMESELMSAAEVHGSRNSSYSQSLNAIGSLYFARGEHPKAISAFKRAYQLRPSEMSFAAFAKVRSIINDMYVGPDRSKAWRAFSSTDDQAFATSRRLLLDGDAESSIQCFGRAVDSVLGNAPYSHGAGARKQLCKGLATLAAGIEGNAPSSVPTVKSVRKVIVSGLGWSGSGAIYDYFREFPEVVAVKGESPYVEGSESLLAIWSALTDDRVLPRRLIDFFFYALVGHGDLRNSGDFKLAKEARTKLLAAHHGDYLDLVEGWCSIAAGLCAADQEGRVKQFGKLVDYTINHFCIGGEIATDQIALLDNVVHTYNAARCIPFLSNTTLICTFRDPRSNYVALVRESSAFRSSVGSYIQERQRRIANSDESARAAKSLAEGLDDRSVEIVQFEEFVLSERFREDLARRTGLDLARQQKFSHFKPWESTRNVTLHQEHPDQEEIRLIAAALEEYCVEPGIRPLNDVNRQMEIT